jgi:alkyl hydroperoxide reductase subunit AhpC
VSIPLVADVTKQIARDYGVLIEDPSDELAGVALRAAFVIDPARRVRAVHVNDEGAGRSARELLRVVAALRHSDASGEGCPASWTEGKDTVVPMPEGSKAFFSKWAKGE